MNFKPRVPMSDSTHPIWGIIQMIVTFGALTLFLNYNYDRFDKRDLVTIAGTFAAWGGAGAIKKLLP